MSRFFTLFSCLALLILALAAPVRADDVGQQSDTLWKGQADCVHAAFRKYPDYTAASNAKREAARRKCLRDHQLPVTGGAAPFVAH